MSNHVDDRHQAPPIRSKNSGYRRLRKRRPILHGLFKMIIMLLLGTLLLALLASTSFLSNFILDRLNQIPVSVNPIAAASHIALVESPAESASGVAMASQVAQTVEPTVTPKHHSRGHGKAPAANSKPDLVKQLSKSTKAVEQEKVRQLADESPVVGLPNKALDPYAEQKLPPPRMVFDGATTHSAQAIVVLGGGLTRDGQGQIIPNAYTRARLLQAISQHRATQLPIFLSGVEAPYMQSWLQAQGESAEWLEARSMNTCENARFSALLLQKLGGAPRVELVTDAWHIPRARWLFAMNGIETIAIPAALPGDPTPWWPSMRNLTHTRRALYELVAFTRDRWFGVVGCREVP
jgi:uncharacterized SAM-binding protein YcdF (DUF218 family)